MKIYYLGCESLVKEYLKSRETLVDSFNDADFLVSYNHNKIFPPEIVAQFKERSFNLHIGYLPMNRGAHPNVWSWIDETLVGVTIHEIDKGVDTGNIYFRRQYCLDKKSETLRSSYLVLQSGIQDLFIANWDALRNGYIGCFKQPIKGSYHYVADLDKYRPCMRNGWDTLISDFLECVGDTQMSTEYWDKYYAEIEVLEKK